MFYYVTALPVNTSYFEAGDGPILLDNAACNKSHLNLSQCVHPLDIGIHNCEEDNIAGVICLNVSSTVAEVTNTSATNKINADPTAKANKSQSALFGSVGAALAVGAIAVVGIVFVVVMGVRRRKNMQQTLNVIRISRMIGFKL